MKGTGVKKRFRLAFERLSTYIRTKEYDTMIEKIPFLHRKKMYNIIVQEDISFSALHHIIDVLIDQGAFVEMTQTTDLYTVVHEEVRYTVGVDGIDIMIVYS